MKFFLSILLSTSLSCLAQNLRDQLHTITTLGSANEFISKNPGAELLTFNSGKDSSALVVKLLKSLNETILEDNGYLYKIVETTADLSFRASYIFLDGKKLSTKQIDSLRKIIISKYKSGTPFPSLAEQYNMDGNRNKGDIGWFGEGIMEEKFESSVKAHRKGDLFTLDIKYNKWYYVILKTYENTEIKTLKVLRVKV